MKGLRLYKKEKLCSAVAIDLLFARGADVHSSLAYPLRVVWRENPRRHSDAPVAFMISVPKRRVRHAVDRVAVRRRIREAYRLNRNTAGIPDSARLDVAFLYVADKPLAYAQIEAAMSKLLNTLSQCHQSPAETR